MIEPTKESVLELVRDWKLCSVCGMKKPSVCWKYVGILPMCSDCYNGCYARPIDEAIREAMKPREVYARTHQAKRP